MKKIFTFLIAVFAITLVKAGTFGMGDYVWKDDATQSVIKTNDAYVKNDRKPVDLEMALGMWTYFKTAGKGTIELQYFRGNANDAPYVAGATGTTQAQSPNYATPWVTINTDSIGKDWVLARNFSSLTDGDYTPAGLTDYSGLAASAGNSAALPQHIVDFGGKILANTSSITLDGTQVPGFVSGDRNYMKGGITFAIMPGATIQPNITYSFRLISSATNWDGETRGSRQGDLAINYNDYEAGQNQINTATYGDPKTINGGNHFDHGMPFLMTGPDINNPVLAVKWTPGGLQASVVNGQVVLNWGTATEVNTKEFTVQRSVSGSNNFVTVGTVASQAKDGNSSSVLKYKYTDHAPLAKAVYRVAEVSADGHLSFSNTASVSLNGSGAQLSVYPNPAASAFLTVKGAAAGNAYRIVSINGISVAKGVINANNQVSVSHLASGVYVLQVAATDGSAQSVMFVKK